MDTKPFAETEPSAANFETCIEELAKGLDEEYGITHTISHSTEYTTFSWAIIGGRSDDSLPARISAFGATLSEAITNYHQKRTDETAA